MGLLVKRIERLARWWVFKFIVKKRAKMLMVNSFYLQSMACSSYDIPPEKTVILRNGLSFQQEQERYDSAVPLAKKEDFIIGFLGRFDPRKRVDRLLAASPSLLKTTEIDTSLVLAGSGPLESEYRSQAQKLGITDKVSFVGRLDNPYSLLKSIDVLVLPSDNEAFSNVVLEAMFAAKPVIVFDQGNGSAEIIDHAKNGFIVSGTNQLEQLLHALRTDSQLAESIGQAAKKSLEEKGLTIQHYIEQLSALIKANSNYN